MRAGSSNSAESFQQAAQSVTVIELRYIRSTNDTRAFTASGRFDNFALNTPEPGTWLMMAAGLALLVLYRAKSPAI